MRKAVFWIHLCAGVIAGLVILIMSLTGVLLTYQRQITAWADSVSVPHPGESASRLSIENLLQKVEVSESKMPTAVTISSDALTAASFSFGRERTLLVDPYTGMILGEGSKRARAFFQLMIDWHRWLGMNGEKRAVGKAITGAANLGFLFLVLSGMYLWWPRNWSARSLKAVMLFDRTATGKARDWNWHNVIGIWSAIPLAVVVFTAVFFSYPWATEFLYRAAGEQPPPRPTTNGARGGETNPTRGERRGSDKTAAVSLPSGLNDSWSKAEAHMPGWRTISLRMASSPTAPLVFTIDRGNGARPDLRGQLTLDPKTGTVEKWEGYESQSPARRIRLWVRWLHTGEAGGWIGQTVAGLASAGGAVLVWTGISLAFRRFFKRNKVHAAEVPETAVSVS
jgi:uncharacterized iron-regulated membrane protein